MGSNLRQTGAFGDELAIVYGASRVNLGLLSCGVSDPSVVDQTTARTFQIPATQSFMLHEDTPEVRSFFSEGEELLLFRDNDEMVEQIKRAVANSDLRSAVSEKAYQRCLHEPYDYSSAAMRIVSYFEELG